MTIKSLGGKTFTVSADEIEVLVEWEDFPGADDGDALFSPDDARALACALMNAAERADRNSLE